VYVIVAGGETRRKSSAEINLERKIARIMAKSSSMCAVVRRKEISASKRLYGVNKAKAMKQQIMAAKGDNKRKYHGESGSGEKCK